MARNDAILLYGPLRPLLHLGCDRARSQRVSGKGFTVTLLNAPWLTAPNTQLVLSTLTGAGYEAYVVGGSVRNTLLGVPVSDLDIATSARPDQVVGVFEASGVKVVPTGIEHGTVTVVLGGAPFEVTTFRKDIETDGRRAVVQFSETMADDAFRRDFTINALYCDATGRDLRSCWRLV